MRLLLKTLVSTPFSFNRDCSAFMYCSKGIDFRKLLKNWMKGLSSLTATFTAGHILQGTIKAELTPATWESTSRSLNSIGIRISSCFRIAAKFSSQSKFPVYRFVLLSLARTLLATCCAANRRSASETSIILIIFVRLIHIAFLLFMSSFVLLRNSPLPTKRREKRLQLFLNFFNV